MAIMNVLQYSPAACTVFCTGWVTRHTGRASVLIIKEFLEFVFVHNSPLPRSKQEGRFKDEKRKHEIMFFIMHNTGPVQ
jgi:hypothetical protein